MAVRFEEMPTSRKGQLKFNDPMTTLEVWAFGAANESELELAALGWIEDTYTVNGVTRFFDSFTYEPHGNTTWSLTVNYRHNPDTNEFTMETAGSTRKMFQSLETVRTYNCVDPASAATLALVATAFAAANTAAADIVLANTARTNLVDEINAMNATIAGTIGGDAGVIAFANQTGAFALSLTNTASLFSTRSTDSVQLDRVSYTASEDGDSVTALAKANASINLVASAQALKEEALSLKNSTVNAATNTDDLATIVGGAANFAIAIAADAVSTKASLLYTAISTAFTSITTAANAALAAATAAAADIVAGANGVPDFKRAINVTENSVEGVDVPDRKMEFSINKKLARSAIPGSYVMELYDLQNTLNDDVYTIVYNGQTLTFMPGTLMFTGFPFKMTSERVLDITYKFSAVRSILLSDDFHIGNSGPIVKTGWEYTWVYYRDRQDTTSNRVIRQPISVNVERCFDSTDFSRIRL